MAFVFIIKNKKKQILSYRISSKERPGAHLKVGIRGAHSRGRSFEGVAHLKISVFGGWGGGGSFDRETAVILEAELKKRKELFSHFDFTVENIPMARFPAALSKKYCS